MLHFLSYPKNLTLFHSQRVLLWRFNVIGNNNEIYLSLRVKFPIFLSEFNQIWVFSKFFHKSLKYQIPRKSDQWSHADTCRQTEGRYEANRPFMRQRERAKKK